MIYNRMVVSIQQGASLFVNPNQLIAGIIFAGLLHGSKENGVIVFFGTIFIIPLLNEQYRRFGAGMRLEYIAMQPDHR